MPLPCPFRDHGTLVIAWAHSCTAND